MSAGESAAQLVFADTNVWLYALLAVQDAGKAVKARAIIRSENILTSTQVINEVCVNMIKKAGFSEKQVQELISSFHARHVVSQLDMETMKNASLMREQYSFSFWDSMIIASAMKAGANVLYTEDMQNGLLIAGTMRIINPFA